jgi:taurine dioxygenase
MQISALDAPLGAEITGLDLAHPVDDSTLDAVTAALDRHAVLVFRDQAALTPEAQIAFSRRFGPLQVHVQRRFLLENHPEILIVSNVFIDGQPIGLVDAGYYWHSDLSYMPRPSLGSLLHAQVVPTDAGDTLFADMRAAFDALDPALKTRLAGLTAEHSYLARNQRQTTLSAHRPALDAAAAATVPPVIHPVIRRHPGSGRAALFVNAGFTTRIVELAPADSADLLARLFDHSTEQRFLYRHRWRAHDLVFWDNRATMHFATGCPLDRPRTLYRTTIEGDEPVAAAAPVANAVGA